MALFIPWLPWLAVFFFAWALSCMPSSQCDSGASKQVSIDFFSTLWYNVINHTKELSYAEIPEPEAKAALLG